MKLWLRRGAIILAWLLIWQLASLLVHNDILLSGPIEIIKTLVVNITKLRFWETVLYSVVRIGAGFLLAFIAGVVIGSLAWRFHALAEFLNPAILFIKSVPIVCFIVLLLVWFGSRATSTVAVFLVAFPAIYISSKEGLLNRDGHISEMLEVFKVPLLQRSLAFNWPSMLPFLLASSRVAVGMSWKSGVAAELIGLPMGSIGERIYQAKIGLSSVDIFSWMIVIVLFSLLCEKLFLLLLRRSQTVAWRLALPRTRQRSASEPSPFCPFCPSPSAPLPVTITDVSREFAGRFVIQHLDLRLDAGGRYALRDASGRGKTTFLHLLAGLLPPSSGTVQNNNSMSMVFQEARLFEKRSAVENLQIVSGHFCERAHIERVLGSVLPAESLVVPVEQLSGGMRRRVELCRALVHPSQLLLLDEPFTGLDSASKEEALRLLCQQVGERTLVIATHDETDRLALDAQTVSVAKVPTVASTPGG